MIFSKTSSFLKSLLGMYYQLSPIILCYPLKISDKTGEKSTWTLLFINNAAKTIIMIEICQQNTYNAVIMYVKDIMRNLNVVEKK